MFTKSRIARVAAAGMIAAALAGAGALPARATADVSTSRIAGTDRYDTAAKTATAAYPSGADTVVVASGESFPDALAGAALAARQAAPLLLTQQATLPASTSAAIDTLKSTKAVILGGTSAVSKNVEDQLAKKVTVSRVAGTNRYDTAAKIAAAIGAANIGNASGRRAALIATGKNFPDALAGGALSAAGSGGVIPVLLVDETGVPPQTKQAITDLGIKQAVILGGTGAVSEATANELQTQTGNAPTRLAGNDRYATAAAVANAEFTDFGFAKTSVVLASGEGFADALAGGPFAGKSKTAILLTPAGSLASATDSFLRTNTATIASIQALGGTSAISDATLAAAAAAAENQQSTTPTGDIAVTPQDEAYQPNGSGSRTYSATGLTGQVDIVLLPCDNVTGLKFKNNNPTDSIADNAALTGPNQAEAPGAGIQTVNGAPNLSSDSDYADDASPSNGTVTFVVGSSPADGQGCVIPVVFVDADSDDGLDMKGSGSTTPDEKFGLGGTTTFAPNPASKGSFTNVTVSGVDKPGDRFVASNQQQQSASYFYDSGDNFQIGGSETTLSKFEAAISPGDTVSGTYDPGATSTFNLTDAAPAAPSIVSAANDADDDDVNITHSDSGTQSVGSYRLYRSTTGGTETNGQVSCANATEYEKVVDEPDDGAPVQTMTDGTPGAVGTINCYKITSIDKSGDEGPMPENSAARGVKVTA